MKKFPARILDELAQVWTVTLKDIKVYYLRPGMIMFGFMMPFFMFFSFSVRREMAAGEGLSRLLALTIFFTAAAAGPFIIPTERRMGTYDRLLAAPMSLITLLLGKISVGAFFAIVVASIAAVFGLIFLDTNIAHPLLMIAGIIIGSFTFSTMGLIFGSIPTRNPGVVQMPSTLIRWGLLFISGVFVPLADMSTVARGFSYISPLTYAQDLMNHAVLGMGELNLWLDLGILFLSGLLFLLPSIKRTNVDVCLGTEPTILYNLQRFRKSSQIYFFSLYLTRFLSTKLVFHDEFMENKGSECVWRNGQNGII